MIAALFALAWEKLKSGTPGKLLAQSLRRQFGQQDTGAFGRASERRQVTKLPERRSLLPSQKEARAQASKPCRAA